MIRAWGNRIAVEDPPADQQDGTVNGIHLPPGMGLDMLCKGIVISVGPEVDRAGLLSPGDVVYYRHGDALELGVKGNLKFIHDHEIIAWEES